MSDIIKDSDLTSFVGLTYVGQAERSMLDRRSDKFKIYNAYLFKVAFDDGVELEIQVNPEFTFDVAESHPFREDLAESFVPYLAVRYKSDRISQELKGTISSTIQHRIDYFDGLAIEIYPMTESLQ